jgi:hypothetical protein
MMKLLFAPTKQSKRGNRKPLQASSSPRNMRIFNKGATNVLMLKMIAKFKSQWPTPNPVFSVDAKISVVFLKKLLLNRNGVM